MVELDTICTEPATISVVQGRNAQFRPDLPSAEIRHWKENGLVGAGMTQ
jgi:hypothetical protein